MLKQIVKRVTLTGSEMELTFEDTSYQYLVKNYSEGDVYVSFYPSFDTSDAIKVASGMGQICVIREKYFTPTDVIYISGTGEVEVQQL